MIYERLTIPVLPLSKVSIRKLVAHSLRVRLNRLPDICWLDWIGSRLWNKPIHQSVWVQVGSSSLQMLIRWTASLFTSLRRSPPVVLRLSRVGISALLLQHRLSIAAPTFQPSPTELFRSPLNSRDCVNVKLCRRTSRRRRHWLFLANAQRHISSIVSYPKPIFHTVPR